MVSDALAGKIEILPAKWIQSHYSEPPPNPLEIRHFAAVACFFMLVTNGASATDRPTRHRPLRGRFTF